jgi:hypothetical protein
VLEKFGENSEVVFAFYSEKHQLRHKLCRNYQNRMNWMVYGQMEEAVKLDEVIRKNSERLDYEE